MRATRSCRLPLFPAICLVAFLPCLKVAGQEISATQRAQRTADYMVVKRVKPLVENWPSAGAQSQEALQKLLDNPNHRVDVDFLAARLAHLRGDPTMAIKILERVIERKAKEKAPGLNMPAWVAAALYRGTIARHHGDLRVARGSYEQLLGPELAGEKSAPTVRAMSNLCLAEIDFAMEKNPKDIIRRLDLVRTSPVPEQNNMMMLHTFYVD